MGAAHLKGPVVHVVYKNGCTGKSGYVSRADAKYTAKRRNLTEIYQCRHCGLWHLSNGQKTTIEQARGL